MSPRTYFALAVASVLASACSGAAPSAEFGAADDKGPTAPANSSSSAAPGASNERGAADTPIDLGRVAAGTEVTFEVPANTVGFTVIVDAPANEGDALGVQELRDPSGTVVVRDFLDSRSSGRSLIGWPGAGAAALRFPLVDDHASERVRAGKWTVRLGGTSAGSGAKGSSAPLASRVHGVVRLQTSTDGAFRGGAIDLDLYVPDGLEIIDDGPARQINAASASSDPGMKTRLDSAFDLFKRLYGLEKGDVRYHAIAASVASVVGQDEVDAANRLATAVSPRIAAQVVLTNRLSPDGPDGGPISGVSNCLPGAVGLPGTACSAVIVSLRGGPAWQDAATLVHELGHFAGLEHTTEFGGDFDTLADTPQCTNTAKSALASCPDHDNLMFPSVNLSTSEASIAVSETQRAIMRSSSLYRR